MKDRRKQLSIYVSLIMVSFCLSNQVKAEFDGAFIESHAIRVVAESGGKAKAASGFLWENNTQVITSLHAIPAGSNITVECRGVRRPATVTNVLAKADLILLTVNGLPSGCLPFNSYQANKPKRNTPLWTFGYHAGARSLTDREFKKRFGSPEKLQYLVTGKPLEEIKKLGYPDPTLDIYYVQGGLLPGYSGGPVVDINGTLLGIVDGGLNKGASSYNWVIPAKFLDELTASSVSQIPNGSNQNTGTLFAFGIDEADDRDVIEYQEEDRKFSWTLTKTQSINELLASADDAEGVGQLSELFAGSSDADAAAKMVFDIYEEQNQGLIIAVPEGQGLRYADDGSDELWLMSGAGATSSGSSGMRFAYSDWQVEDEFGGVIEPNKPDYFKHLITSLIIECHNPGKSFCYFDEATIRIIDFGQGNKILRIGVITDYYDSNIQPHYDYYSFAVRGNTPFGAQGQIPVQRGSDLYQCLVQDDENACETATVVTDKLAQLFAVHLTTFSGITTNSDSKILNTEFQYDASKDWADTIFVPYYEGEELRFFNTRGREWRVYSNNDYEIANQVWRDFNSPGTNPMVTLEYGDINFRFPVKGGEYFYRNADATEWQVAGSVTPQWTVENQKYLENGQVLFERQGAGYWNVYEEDGVHVVQETSADADNRGNEFVSLRSPNFKYIVPIEGGDYSKYTLDDLPVSTGVVEVNQ
jgi:S1-C subfamily serine protease